MSAKSWTTVTASSRPTALRARALAGFRGEFSQEGVGGVVFRA